MHGGPVDVGRPELPAMHTCANAEYLIAGDIDEIASFAGLPHTGRDTALASHVCFHSAKDL